MLLRTRHEAGSRCRYSRLPEKSGAVRIVRDQDGVSVEGQREIAPPWLTDERRPRATGSSPRPHRASSAAARRRRFSRTARDLWI